jgi:hypothetical protein
MPFEEKSLIQKINFVARKSGGIKNISPDFRAKTKMIIKIFPKKYIKNKS